MTMRIFANALFTGLFSGVIVVLSQFLRTGEYVARSYAVALAGWPMLGLAMAWFWSRPQTA